MVSILSQAGFFYHPIKILIYCCFSLANVKLAIHYPTLWQIHLPGSRFEAKMLDLRNDLGLKSSFREGLSSDKILTLFLVDKTDYEGAYE